MPLTERINKDYITAYKAGNETEVAVLRLLKTAIANLRVELRRDPTDAEVLELAAKQAKQRREAMEQFSKAGRAELADREKAELAVLRTYLPQQMNDREIEALVAETVARLGASGMKDMGRVMQAVMAEAKGRADGKAVSESVRERLSGPV